MKLTTIPGILFRLTVVTVTIGLCCSSTMAGKSETDPNEELAQSHPYAYYLVTEKDLRKLQNTFLIVLKQAASPKPNLDDKRCHIPGKRATLCRSIRGNLFTQLHDGTNYLASGYAHNRSQAEKLCREQHQGHCKLLFTGLHKKTVPTIFKMRRQHLASAFRFIRRKPSTSRGLVVPYQPHNTVTLLAGPSPRAKKNLIIDKPTHCQIEKIHTSTSEPYSGVAKVICQQHKGYINLSYLVHDYQAKFNRNRTIALVTWKTECGGDSCSLQTLLFNKEGWLRPIAEFDETHLVDGGRYVLFQLSQNRGPHAPLQPELWLEHSKSGERRFLTYGASPTVVENKKLVLYRTPDGSVERINFNGNARKLVYPSTYPAESMHVIHTTSTDYQPAVVLLKADRIKIPFMPYSTSEQINVKTSHKIIPLH